MGCGLNRFGRGVGWEIGRMIVGEDEGLDRREELFVGRFSDHEGFVVICRFSK